MNILFKALYALLPVTKLPVVFNDLVLGFTKYAYFANYYLPISEILSLISIILGFESSLYLFHFLV